VIALKSAYVLPEVAEEVLKVVALVIPVPVVLGLVVAVLSVFHNSIRFSGP